MTETLARALARASPVASVVSLPGSKSLTNRALVLAALADGPERRTPTAALARHLADGRGRCAAMGIGVEDRDDDWLVTPGPLVGDADVDCGLAGTVMRFVPPVAGLSTGTHRLRRRPAHAQPPGGRGARPRWPRLGVRVEDEGRGALPFTVRGTGAVPGGTVVIDASASSQFISALLLAGARYDAGVDVRHDGKPVPSLPHIEMTVAMLRERGVEVDDTDANRWAVAPGPVAAVDQAIEPDLSNAAPFLALAATTGGPSPSATGRPAPPSPATRCARC